MLLGSVAWWQTASDINSPGEQRACAPAERDEVLRSWQTLVLKSFPREVDSLERVTQTGGPLEGWRLSHGHVVIAGGGAVPIDNAKMKAPMPPILMYAPSPSSSPADWLDFDGPDGPYRLVGWAYFAPFEPGSAPPKMPCIRDSEWFVHEAGWHLTNGGMLLTPDAKVEPPRPPIKTGIHMWHPQVWDIHFWIGENSPTVSFDNPTGPEGGLCLSPSAFYVFRNGRKVPVSHEQRCRVVADPPTNAEPLSDA